MEYAHSLTGHGVSSVILRSVNWVCVVDLAGLITRYELPLYRFSEISGCIKTRLFVRRNTGALCVEVPLRLLCAGVDVLRCVCRPCSVPSDRVPWLCMVFTRSDLICMEKFCQTQTDTHPPESGS